MTQVELGEKVGVSGVAIMRYEKGTREPRLEQLQAIATAVGFSLADFLEGKDAKIFSMGLDEGADVEIQVQKDMFGYSFSRTETWLIAAFSRLNDAGQQRAVECVEELSEIPRYQRTATQEGKSVDGQETPPDVKEQ